MVNLSGVLVAFKVYLQDYMRQHVFNLLFSRREMFLYLENGFVKVPEQGLGN